jgi:amidohydrolase
MLDRIRSLNDQHFDWIVDIRRRLHRRPELAFEEHETAKLVADRLREIGLEPRTGVAKTGVVADIVGARPGPARALRADMDALPIRELTLLPFASEKDGVMHACGHDAHVASLLGAARILVELKDELEGSVRLIFQPSEERTPGGAPGMIAAGALAASDGRPAPSLILGQHVRTDLPTGIIGFRGGPFMASSDEVYLTIRGEGGHAAEPHRLRADAVLVQAHVLTALQSVISRHCPPDVPSVLSFGRVIANGATNIIPAEVQIEGTFRSMDDAWRFRAHELIERTATETARAFGATCDVRIAVGYPALFNDPDLTAATRAAAVEYVGEENVVDLEPWYASEDFAFYTKEIPGSFYVVGVRSEDAGAVHPLHTPQFTIDEEALRLAPGFMAYAALAVP